MNIWAFVIGSSHLAYNFQDSQNLFIWRGICYYFVIFEQYLPAWTRLALNLTSFCQHPDSRVRELQVCAASPSAQHFIQLVGV